MTRHFFTALLFLSVILFSFNACKTMPEKSEEARRFAGLLKQAALPDNDSVDYIIWNSSSCAGCRQFTGRLLMRHNSSQPPVVLITPLNYSNEAGNINSRHLYIDSARIFDEYYFGIDNVGIIRVGKEGVYSLKNYNANAMDTLQRDFMNR